MDRASDKDPPERSPLEVFRARPTWRRPRSRPRTRWRDHISSIAWDPPPGKCSWGGGRSAVPCLACCLGDPTPDKRKIIMDGLLLVESSSNCNGFKTGISSVLKIQQDELRLNLNLSAPKTRAGKVPPIPPEANESCNS